MADAKQHPPEAGEKLTAPADFTGPVKDRKCTDILFSLLILCMWAAMTALGIDGIQNGDPYILIAPVDYKGNICGHSSGYEDLDYLYYISTSGYGVCVSECPSTTDLDTVVCMYDTTSSTSWPSSYSDATLVADGYCMYQYATTNYLYYCVIDDAEIWDEFSTSTYGEYLTEFVADIYTAAAYIFGFGFCVAILLGFVYVVLMRLPGLVALLVWLCIGLVLAAFTGLGCALYVTCKQWDAEDPSTHETYEIDGAFGLAIAFWCLAFIWFCLAFFMRARISLAIGVIKEASRAVAAMPLLVLFPFLQLVGLVAFLACWVVYAVYTASLGTYDTETATFSDVTLHYVSFSYSNEIEYRGWFLLFCLFWTAAFITAIGQIVIAMAVATWYFSRDKGSVGSGTVLSSIGKSMFYHTGTAAFGSLIIAIIQMIEAVLSYVKAKAQATGNKIAEYVACCCICCFWCLEKCMRFINKNAYIQTAIFSTSFCASAKKAFWLIARNIARIGAVTVLSEFILIIMELFIMAVAGALSYWVMSSTIEDDLNSIVGPVVMVMILAFFVANMFMSVYGMAISTVLQCFIADEEMFAPGQRFAEHDLREWVNEHGGGGGKNGKGEGLQPQHHSV